LAPIRSAVRVRAAEPARLLLRDPNNVLGSPPRASAVSDQLRVAVAAYETLLALRIRADAQSEAFARQSRESSAPLDDVRRMVRRAERATLASVREAVELHVVWPWISQVRGIGHLLAARLLARLDLSKAHTPSAFWMYCGLATVAADTFDCAACATRVSVAGGRRPPRGHRTRAGTWCFAQVERRSGAGERIAMPRPARGERQRYNPDAKVACYLIGLSFVRRGDLYRDIYELRRAAADSVHPDWPPGRRYLLAQRVAVKRFLADLWVAWRQAEGLPTREGLTQRLSPRASPLPAESLPSRRARSRA
jgi:hypothetical protein